MTRNDAAQRPENHVIVLFGATGDLARRKLLPGLFHLHAAGSHARGLACDPASLIRMTSRGISGFLSSRTANSAANSSVA